MKESALALLFERYRQDPVFYIEHALGLQTWSKMREVAESVRDNQMTAVRATHSSSKTFTAACLSVWFFNCFTSSRLVTTAPTEMQVVKLLWTEINKLYRTARVTPEGTCFKSSIVTKNAEHDGIGFSTNEGARAEGFHAPELMFVFDEAKGIQPWMFDAAQGALTGGFCRWLVISTTDGCSPGDDFFEIFSGPAGQDWHKIHIDCKHTPYYTGERFRKIEWIDNNPFDFRYVYTDPEELKPFIQLATPEWEQRCINRWGADSILYYTKCRGQIVDQAPDIIVHLSNVYRMYENHKDRRFDTIGAEEIGVDVARFGDDSSAIFKRKGMKVLSWEEHNKQDTVFIANRVKEVANHNKELRIKVDDTGVGGGVVDILKSEGYNVIPVNFHGTAKDPDSFPNVISEMWFEVADLVPLIACPEIERLKVELVNRKKKDLDSKGRRVVESKGDYKKRLGGKSPDFADAFLLCFYNPKPNKRKLTIRASGQRYSRGVLRKYKL